MTEAAKAPFTRPALPTDPTAGTRAALVLGGIVGGVLAVASDYPTLAGVLVASAGARWYFLGRLRARAVGIHVVLAAIDRTMRGQVDEARWLLDQAEPVLRRSVFEESLLLVRAEIALEQGALEDAASLAERAASTGKSVDSRVRAEATGLRALALAALGKSVDARAIEHPTKAPSPRAGLAEAVALARASDLEGLATFLRSERRSLSRSLGARERTVLRALVRLVTASQGGAYRKPAGRTDIESNEASWAKTIVPEAADFVREQVLPRTFEPRKKSPVPAAPLPGRPTSAIVDRLPGSASVSALLGLALVYTPALEWLESNESILASARGTFGLFALGFALVLAVSARVRRQLRNRRAARDKDELENAKERYFEGDIEGARALYERIAEHGLPIEAATAHLGLASLASSDGSFVDAERHARAGLAEIHTELSSYFVGHAYLQPSLHTELAVALAGQRREDEAQAQLRTLVDSFPTFPRLAASVFVTDLLSAVVRHAFTEAAELARRRTLSLALAWDAELLCDLVRVHENDPLPEGERARVVADLGENPQFLAMLERVAPQLVPEELGPKTRVGVLYEERVPDVAPALSHEQDEQDDLASADEPTTAPRRAWRP